MRLQADVGDSMLFDCIGGILFDLYEIIRAVVRCCLYVLLHEQGHILCRHFSEGSVMGTDVIQEHEANEFVHYVMDPTVGMKLAVRRKPIILLLSVIIIAVVIIVLIRAINQQKSFYGEYYITETGHKYHQADCIFVKNKTNVRRLTEEEFQSGDYEECEICLPD